MGASWVTEGITSRYDALLTFSGTNCETDSIRNKMINSQRGALSGFQWISRGVMRMAPIARGTATQMRAEDVIWAAWPDHWPASIQPKVSPVFTQLPAR
jgi:hypothetical protein